MKLQENYSLKKFNTFRVDVSAKIFAEVHTEVELVEVLEKYPDEKKLVLGEGANILLTKDFDGLVIKNSIEGIEITSEDDEYAIFEVGAGENWHEFVLHVVELGLGGIENLVYIPGSVGAAPVQNIAAYGQNFEDVFVSLDAIDLDTFEKNTFEKVDCEFEYRNSRFKTRENGKYIVTRVRVKLSKNPKINTSYFETGKTYAKNVSLSGELSKIKNPTVKDVSEAVMKIRKSKLPEVSEVGTAGSVFKNPVVTRAKYEELKKDDPDLQSYPIHNLSYENNVSGEYVKIPAGRLLDNLGWKGRRKENVGTHKTQALAVVNYGNATPQKILEFMGEMKRVVKESYGIDLEEEILII
jgi:UDP-N-acetylmuramate dehydrogenase